MNAAGPGYETFPMEFDLNGTPTCQYMSDMHFYTHRWTHYCCNWKTSTVCNLQTMAACLRNTWIKSFF
jgi:hypothetical protein